MARRKVIAKKKRWRCPICHRHSYNIRGLALHLAMKRDNAHAKWRQENGLPIDYQTMKEMQEITNMIIKIIQQEPEKYSW